MVLGYRLSEKLGNTEEKMQNEQNGQ